ncbi:DUF7713 domain-containing protein [Caballeronia sp. EK]|uniref:DUF7713 domain-containing protein n=1 Tax=Caballeronia sp. EK TaxID=2767469 RepID=UPI002106B811|nr:hypothetical protein [Caballeronia sp. EK]
MAVPVAPAHATIHVNWVTLDGDLMTQTRWERCRADKPAHDFVRAGSSDGTWRVLRSQCFNDEMAQFADLRNFEHPNFTPLRLLDVHGDEHEFHFRSLLLGEQLSLEAFELMGDDDSGGYRFQILGDPESEPFAPMAQLVQKIKRALGITHLVADAGGLQVAETIVRGRLEWDGVEHTSQPCVIIDGRRVDWRDFGAMLLAFEGWQFRLELLDPSDEA